VLGSTELSGWRDAARERAVWLGLLRRVLWTALCVAAGASGIPVSVVLPAAIAGNLVASLAALRATGGQRLSLLPGEVLQEEPDGRMGG